MDYVIIGQLRGGARLLLVKRGEEDDPMAPARAYVRADNELLRVTPVGSYRKFNLWEDYDGPQDALVGVIPDRVFE